MSEKIVKLITTRDGRHIAGIAFYNQWKPAKDDQPPIKSHIVYIKAYDTVIEAELASDLAVINATYGLPILDGVDEAITGLNLNNGGSHE